MQKNYLKILLIAKMKETLIVKQVGEKDQFNEKYRYFIVILYMMANMTSSIP